MEVEDLGGAAASNTRAAVEMREADDISMREMIDGMGANQGFELRVYRTSPKKWGSPPVSIEGHVGTFNEWMGEEELKGLFGGGTLQLKVYKPNAKGALTYFKAVSVKLPGKPKGEGIEEPVDVTPVFDHAPAEDSGAVTQAMDMMAKLVEDGRGGNGGTDMTMVMSMLATMMEPMKANQAANAASLTALQVAAAEKDARIIELIGAKPDTSENDKLVHKMFDTEANRTNNLRAIHESEMRTMRENSREDIKRAEDRHREELRSREESHRREIDNLNRSHDQQTSTLKMSYDSRLDTAKADSTRIDRDLTDSRTELIALRAKKDKTIIEQASEFSQIKDALETITGGGGDSDDRKWYEKVLGQVVENPESIGHMVGMVTGGNPGAPTQTQQLQQALPPQTQPTTPTPTEEPPAENAEKEVSNVDDIPIGHAFKDETGKLWIKVPPDGSVVPYEQGLAMARAEEERRSGTKRPSEQEVKVAIKFMESAFSAGTEATVFAASARSMIPSDILKYMESVGVDVFLNDVAKLEQNSPLRNQAGRTFMRDVAKFLLEGVPS